MVYFKIDDDPEVYDLLADAIKTNFAHFTTDDILTILVNFSHTLSPETVALFDFANSEFAARLNQNYNP